MKFKGQSVAYLAVRLDEDGDLLGFRLHQELKQAVDWVEGDEEDDNPGTDAVQIPPPASQHSSASKDNPLASWMDRLSDNILPYYSLIDLGFQARIIFTYAHMVSDIFNPLNENGDVVQSGDDWKVFKLNESGIDAIDKATSKLKRMNKGLAALPGSTLMSMVAAFDSAIAELIATLLKSQKEKLISSDKSVPISEILSSGSIDEIVDKFVAQKVYEVLRGSHDDQVGYIESTFDIKIRSEWWGWKDFIELFERRNLIAHGEGNYNGRYAEICARHGATDNVRPVGEVIKLDRNYLNHVADLLLEFGILLVFSLWRKSNKAGESQAFEALNEMSFRLICENRLRTADNILNFGLSLKNTKCSEYTKRMMIVNRANALKKLGKDDAAEKVLSSVEWQASSDKFQICVFAIRADVDAVVKKMEALKLSGEITKDDFRDWPVFDHVRADEKFRDEFERIFGEPLSAENKQEMAGNTCLPGEPNPLIPAGEIVH